MASYKKPCIQCGAFVDGNVEYCPGCGTSTPFSYHCPYCKRQVTEFENVCATCGKPLRVNCPSCGKPTFTGRTTCQSCGGSLMVTCPNSRCGKDQFYALTKCSECGKKLHK
ncbi:MAG: zinc ribbon domain-containing protein [Coriobacteriia bacterium]|nr:zinc ribbon domain-containing protein [Coriobacteriia bacterium]